MAKLSMNDVTERIFLIIFGLALLPVAFDSIADFAVAYPEWATLIGIVSIGLIFMLVKGVLPSMK